MSRAFAGKVAVVTGSTRGLGKAMAHAFLEEGAAVVVSGRSPEAVGQASAELGSLGAHVFGQACDVASREQVHALAEAALQQFGQLDIWVNNAGLSAPYGPTLAVAPEVFEGVVGTNILGVYHGAMEALGIFVPRGSGKLINMLGFGDRGSAPLQNAYGASKSWIRAFTRSLADEYQSSGIGVFAFNPGLVRTDLTLRPTAVAGYEGRLGGAFVAVLRMWSSPPELPARKAVWIASSATDGRTGLEVRFGGPGRLLLGALGEIGRRVTRRPGPEVSIQIETVQPAAGDPGGPRLKKP